MKEIKCKNCPYYSGIQCHGHGEYWASCTLIESLRNTLAAITKTYKYDIKLKKYETVWVEALDENSTCILMEIENANN